jgi:hypothetical protein
MISFPTLDKLVQEAIQTLRRFPFVLLFATVATFLSLWISGADYQENIWQEMRVIMSCGLAALLCLSITLLSEKQGWGAKGIVYQIIAIILIGIYYWFDTEIEAKTTFVRFGLLTVFAHLLVAIAPYLLSNQKNGFWQYNQQLFIRILLSALYTTVLYLGLALAMVALDTLFGVDFGNRIYMQLWIFLLGIFNTWFFLAGIPSDYEVLDKDETYPKGLKLFTQFVLLPLVVIYFLILYAYSAKILIEWNLPKGWVSWLILCLSVAGIFSLLLIEPIKNKEENRWISQFSKVFYFAIFPLVILLGVSIWKRVNEYGITELRYFVIILAFWLTGISIYFLASKEKNIRWIPISLSIIILLSAYSPFNAFVVSRMSQFNRLESLAEKYGLLKNGKFTKMPHTILDTKDSQEMLSILGFFEDDKNLKYCQSLFYISIDSLEKIQKDGKTISADSMVYYSLTQRLAELGGFNTSHNMQIYDESGNPIVIHYFYVENLKEVFDIKGFDYSFKISLYDESQINPIKVSNFSVSIDSTQLYIVEGEKKNIFSLNEFTKKMMQKIKNPTLNYEYLTHEDMTYETANESFRVKIYCNNASIVDKGKQQYHFSVLDTQILIAKIPEK